MSSLFSATAFDRFFDDVMGTSFGAATNRRNFVPDVDVFARQGEVEFVCDLPGVKKEDLEVTVEGRVLTIKGERKFDGDKGKQAQVVLGRSYGSFSRAYTLPADLDTENLKADLADGVLTLRIPKTEKAKPRKVEIGAGSNEKKLGQ